MKKICFEFPDKKRYNTQREAETVMLLINNADLKTYYCMTCKGWHLTSN